MQKRHRAACPECGVGPADQCVATDGRKIGKHEKRRVMEKFNRKNR